MLKRLLLTSFQASVLRIGIFAVLVSISLSSASFGGILISGYLANPEGTDSPNEYVQLVATSDTNFASENFSVVWANNGTATNAGWTASGALTYGFNLNSGFAAAGTTFYVGGNGRVINGVGSTSIASANWIRDINTGTTGGDTFGNLSNAGVMGNGGTNADGIAVFSGLTSSITSSTAPVDALFFGTVTGSAVVTGGTAGYELPTNDRYTGGKLQSTSFLFPEPVSGRFTRLTGTFDTISNSWTTARSGSNVALSPSSTITDINSAISITAVPEPTSLALLGMAGCAGLVAAYRRRKLKKIATV